mgnify:CR=1 FL=1
MNTPGQNSNAVAELAFGLMVMAVRNMYNGHLRYGTDGQEAGYSRLWQCRTQCGAYRQGFRHGHLCFRRFLPERSDREDGVKAVASAEELYSTCDVVSLHIPATEKPRILLLCFGEQDAERRFAGQYRRKEVINEAELIQLMEERTRPEIHDRHHACSQ